MSTAYFADEDELAARAASYIRADAERAISERGVFLMAVSGGKSPAKMFRALSQIPLAWSKISLFQVDERALPQGDQGRNSRLLEENLLAHLSVRPRTFLMPVERPSLDEAASEYELVLRRELGPDLALDLVHLGLGADGHTASLLPHDDAVLNETEKLCAKTQVYQGTRRLTLTAPLLSRARTLLWLVAGADKASALGQLVRGDPHIPAGLLAQVPSVVFALEDARAPAPL